MVIVNTFGLYCMTLTEQKTVENATHRKVKCVDMMFLQHKHLSGLATVSCHSITVKFHPTVKQGLKTRVCVEHFSRTASALISSTIHRSCNILYLIKCGICSKYNQIIMTVIEISLYYALLL